jgi:hypothetical protein
VYFLDWCIEHGQKGEHDKDEILALTRSFDKFARAGIQHEKIDMPRTHPRYAQKQAKGCKRQRLRIYNLPTEIPDCFVPATDVAPRPLAAQTSLNRSEILGLL